MSIDSVERDIAMASPQNFLDNLENLRLVTSVALDHTQKNLDRFVKNANGVEMRRAERSISKIRSLAEQLEKEFNALEHAVAKMRSTRESGE
jgi:phage regulator Rha-like protein